MFAVPELKGKASQSDPSISDPEVPSNSWHPVPFLLQLVFCFPQGQMKVGDIVPISLRTMKTGLTPFHAARCKKSTTFSFFAIKACVCVSGPFR